MKITEGLANENEISRLVGIMDTNSHEIFNRNGYICKGIYPLVSFLSHGCIINARPCIKVKTILEDSLDSIQSPSPFSENSNTWRESLLEIIRHCWVMPTNF